jgi:hypothetical protein
MRDVAQADWDDFARQHLALLVAVLLRIVSGPSVAFDLALETLATLRRRWSECPADDEDRLIWAFDTSQALIATAVARGVVPSVERTRDQHPDHKVLSVTEQRQIIALSEQRLDLPPRVRDVVDAMARDAPAPRQLRALRCSPLVGAEPLPDPARETDGA